MSETIGERIGERAGEKTCKKAGDGTGDETGEKTGRMRSPTETGRDAARATVQVNGAELDWPGVGSVDDLLSRLGLQGKRVAVSVNRSVIPRSRHREASVQPGDRIEILEAVGGG